MRGNERTFLDGSFPDIADEKVIGVDNRIQVPANQLNLDPFTAILELEIDFPTGQEYGTAWLISPTVAVTAGHCLINDQGQNATKITLHQAGSGMEVGGKSFFVSDAFRSGNRDNNDFGVIELKQPFSDAANIGYSAYTDSQLAQETFNIAGYPVDKPRHTIWFHSGKLSSIGPIKVRYQMDTVGGQSGSPVIDVVRVNGTQKFVSAAIHQGFDGSLNLATRITSSVFHKIEEWRSKIQS